MIDPGLEVEERVRTYAARLGVADFVMFPLVTRKGSATREVGDGFLVCGELGAVLQVKARDTVAAQSDDDDAARRWILKKVGEAVRQGRGTKRALRLAPVPPSLISLRSLDAPAERRDEFCRPLPSSASLWPIIVVIDHPTAPPVGVECADDVFVVSFDDWRFLHSAIRSTTGILRYLNRVFATRHHFDVRVGHERARFDQLCAADAATDDGSETWTPEFSYAALDDPEAADVFQHFIDRAWPKGAPLPTVPVASHLPIIEELDRDPTPHRVSAGERWRRYIDQTKTSGRASGTVVTPTLVIVMVVESSPVPCEIDWWIAQLQLITEARTDRLLPHLGARRVLGVGVLSQPEHTDYLFALVIEPKNKPPLPAEVLEHMENEFGQLPSSAVSLLKQLRS